MGKTSSLHLAFHGRIIDHIGARLYQSPTAALAEHVSNAWDADATRVDISLDFDSKEKSEWTITIKDDGNGMTRDECQRKFLNVGYNRREGEGGPSAKSPGGRPLMGRKGIGKFAGFGIARFIKVDTTSASGRERTVFELDRRVVREGDGGVSNDNLKIEARHPEAREGSWQGTTITLRDLELGKRISSKQLGSSLSRRFLINEISDDFKINIGGVAVSNGVETPHIEMNFPRDLPDKDKKDRGIRVDGDGWGTEMIAGERRVRWRVLFFKESVKDEELSGISVFAHKKMAQRPFMFNLSGGLASRAGPEYMSGQVIADWVDEFDEDLISTERGHLHWDHPELTEFRDWGRKLVKQLTRVWKNERSLNTVRVLESKMEGFSERLDKLGRTGKTARNALMKLAGIEKLSPDQFQEIGSAILIACEKGRLEDLIEEISKNDEMDEGKFVGILAEAHIMTTLHTAEVVYTKLQAIKGLEMRVEGRQIENAVRDYIAKNPWLISPRWETFAVEERLSTICKKTGGDIFGNSGEFNGRVDLLLSSGSQLLLLEFMRPGLTIDFDHINRFSNYASIIRHHISSTTGLGFKQLSGYIIADKISNKIGIPELLNQIEQSELYAMDWMSLIEQSKHQWKEFLDHVKLRAPDDPRLNNMGVFGLIEPGGH